MSGRIAAVRQAIRLLRERTSLDWKAPQLRVSAAPKSLGPARLATQFVTSYRPRLVRSLVTVSTATQQSNGGSKDELDVSQLLCNQGHDVAVSVFEEMPQWQDLAESLEKDASALLQKLNETQIAAQVELCNDQYIAELNKEWRGKEGPTDVLSFETESPPGYPLHVLGDIVISLETADRQAAERGHSLHEECRILLVHGVLHVLGFDHEQDKEGKATMASKEKTLLEALQWQGQGLISSASVEENLHEGEAAETSEPSSSSSSGTIDETFSSHTHQQILPRQRMHTRQRKDRSERIKLLALDMDGTLLDSQSQVLKSSVEALHAALSVGVRVCLATGKARPAALAAMEKIGLAGDGLVVSKTGPGLFLQGLAVHGYDGTLLEGPDLPHPIVRAAFDYAAELDVPLAAFLGDECKTLKMHPELQELHYRYYEPLCREISSLDALLAGPPVKKLLFMTDAGRIAKEHQPHWTAFVQGKGADTTMAVPNMLEILPEGINKWVGMQLLLEDLGISRDELMSCGDGNNDLQLVANSGIGIAMGNAVPAVKEAAHTVVSSNDKGGIAEAIETFIL